MSYAETWVHRDQSALRAFRLQKIWNAPCHMNLAERLQLFATVYSRAVTRYVEIGTAKGGSALIVNEAFELLESQGIKSTGVCIDRKFTSISPKNREILSQRFAFVEHPTSMLAVKEAFRAAGGHFDFALIDGGHDVDQAVFDTMLLLPYMAAGAYMFFHDSAYPGVLQAFDYLEANTSLQRCGAICRHANLASENKGDSSDDWAGISLMRVHDNHVPIDPPVASL
jgi:cephalosporin hydroxylase